MAASWGLQSGRRALQIAACSLALATLLAPGCTRETDTRLPAVKREPPQTATDLLKWMVEAYHQADSYQDSGRLLLQYTHEGKVIKESRDFSLALDGPNRIRLRAYDALIVCDGRNFRAVIDEAPDEVLSVPAPEELSMGVIYGDPVLGNALNQIVGSVPLALYLDPTPLPALLANSQTPQLDSSRKIGDRDCYRVRIDRREGSLVLWIDEQSLALRRVEYPTDGYRRLLETHRGPVADMTITAELEDARLDEPVDDATFRFDVPKQAVLVKRFESLRLGAPVPRFELRTLDGGLITRDSLAGKIAVLKFWRKDDVYKCYKDLSGFEQVRRRYEDNDALVFLAVSADLDDVSDDDLRAAFAEADISLPIARVDLRYAVRSFGLQVVPSTLIIGEDGDLQEQTAGTYPDQTAELPKKLDLLLTGGDLALEAPETVEEHLFYSAFGWQNPQQRLEDEAHLAMAAALAKAGISPRSTPRLLKAKRLWSCSQLRQPGNILTIPGESASDRIFVVEALPCVAEVGPEGTVLVKRRLELSDRDDAAVAFLRTGVDGDGNRYFVGSKTAVQQVHLFDADWKRVLSFPEAGEHAGISDARLADLDGDGALEMFVSYLFEVGVHCVTLDGERLWRSPVGDTVFRLALGGTDRQGRRRLLAAQGLIVPIDADGREGLAVGLRDAFLQHVFTADLDGDDRSEWCVIARQFRGLDVPLQMLAVGFSSRGEELWRYPLPEGTHQHSSLDMVASGNLLGDETGQWVIAGADGSIHLLDVDGNLIDCFNYGAAISGLAVASLEGKPVLLVSTDESMDAWQFELPPPKEPAAQDEP